MLCFRIANCFSAGERMKTRSPSVIVIGGGFGGISAARTLQDASFQVCDYTQQMKFQV